MKETAKRGFCALCVVLLLTACGAKEPTWQEQYDLGVRYLSEGNYEEAIIAFTAAIEIDPKQAPAYVGRGDAYMGSGEAAENLTAAQVDYEKAIELDETVADVYLKLAEIYLQQGDTEAAIAILKQGYQVTGNESLKARRQELGLSGNDEVVWTDEVFENLIRDKLGIPTGPVYVKDLDEITSLIICGNMAFLNGDENVLECFHRHLSHLDDTREYGELVAYYGYKVGEEHKEYTTLGGIKSVDTLQYFRNLRSVSVIANQVKDVSILKEMENLDYAYFWGNEISDLSPIYALPRHSDRQEQFVKIGDILPIN